MSTSRDRSLLPRLRAGAVGTASAGTGVLAHAQAHGALPGSSGLVVVAAAGIALGLVAGRTGTTTQTAATWRLLPLLAAGQMTVHLLLIALTGHHDQLVTTPMAALHALGTLAALGLIAAAESLVRAVSGLARRVVALRQSGPFTSPSGGVAASSYRPLPHALRHLGAVGTRGPPLFV